jgi:hypothetical protein
MGMQRTLILALALGPAACLPPPQDAGDVDPTGSAGPGGATVSDGSADGGTETQGAPTHADVEWSLVLPSDAPIHRMIRSPQGVVAVMQGDDAEVVEISASMDELWSVTLDQGHVLDLDALGDGGYVLAGSSAPPPANVPVPTAWTLSCCGASTGQAEHPALAPDSFLVGKPLAGGLYLVIEHGSAPAGFMHSPLEPGPALSEGELLFAVIKGTVTPAGSVLLSATEGGDPKWLYQVEPDGSGDWYGADGFTSFVGSGADLTLVRYGNDHMIGIRPYAGGSAVWVPVPGFDYSNIYLARHEHIVAVYLSDEPEYDGIVRMTEFEDDGTILRTVIIPNVQDPPMLTAVAVGEDGAIYVAVREGVMVDESLGTAYLHRIAPLE